MSEPEFLRVESAASLLGLSRSSCYAMIARGELPSVRLGGRSLRIPRRQLAEWMERQAPARMPADRVEASAIAEDEA